MTERAPVDRLGKLKQRATELRKAMIDTRGGSLISFEYFPRGACGDAAVLLAQYFHDHDLGDWEYVSGERFASSPRAASRSIPSRRVSQPVRSVGS